ncbi:hypothetical protein Vadar_021918 [Vaccinium darrowii]|uniref:Uncharacterized protein n=1 Tax=Vaccinium darrowii TaxID=229202 RepID=A0ACB7Z6G8_9ERIC|nr:hypothetical protein Vadar_021918 [Vaccinium darrowii]
MAEVLVFGYTAIRDWVLNLQILLLVGVVLVGALHCFVSELSRYSQSAKIFKQGQVLTRAIKPRAEANLSFRANEDQRLTSSSWKPDSVLGPCDGIFCLFWRSTTSYPNIRRSRVERLALWNPATRAFSILPMSKFDAPQYKKVFSCLVGFGFDLTTKSIKVVKVVCLCIGELVDEDGGIRLDNCNNCAEVYDLGSGSWRVIHVDATLQNVFVVDDPSHGMYNNNDGVFHWHSLRVFRGIIENWTGLVLSFDMSRELFHVTLMPERYNFELSLFFPFKFCYFSMLRDSLAVNFTFFEKCHERRSTFELWVMKEDFYCVVEAGESFSSYSWSHELTVELPNNTFYASMGFWNENELLLWELSTKRGGDSPFLYDIVTKQARVLRELNFLYKDSLVSVKGGRGNDSIP